MAVLILSFIVIQVVLVHEGVTSLIAHITVGKMQAALKVKTTGLPTVGKDVCSVGQKVTLSSVIGPR